VKHQSERVTLGPEVPGEKTTQITRRTSDQDSLMVNHVARAN
jgi:hypothetical protein